MSTEISNTFIEGELESRAIEVMAEMFGEATVKEASIISSDWSTLLLQIQEEPNWNIFAEYTALGAFAGAALGALVSKAMIDMARNKAFPHIHPDPAHGCGCYLTLYGGLAGTVVGGVVGYYIAKGGF
jgi:hypothetical protein